MAKKNKKKTGKRTVLWVILAVEIIILAAALLVLWTLSFSGKETTPAETQPSTEAAIEDTIPQITVPEPEVEELVASSSYLDHGLQITNVASYTGAYIEDGSNEIVSDVLMIIVENIGKSSIQYAEITLPTENGDAKFNLSTLPAGESCVLLELNRMAYTGKEDVTQAVAENVAVFSEDLSLREDILKLQILDGAINVINISGQSIDGDVIIYYKNAASDLYYGGITYRVRIEGGLKTDEIKQIMASHFSDTGSKIMFVTVDG